MNRKHNGRTNEALNILEGIIYDHHPVLKQIPLSYFPFDKDYITELNGLKVPAAFDCDNFNNGKSWGNHKYFYEVPTRW